MSNLFDTSRAEEIAEMVITLLMDDGGYTIEEAIPGLVVSIKLLAESGPATEMYLDETARLLDTEP